MSPGGATYMQHLQWVEQELVGAKFAHFAADKLSRDARGMSDIIERADGYQAEAPKLAASVVQQAEEAAKRAGWDTDGGLHYCQSCANKKDAEP